MVFEGYVAYTKNQFEQEQQSANIILKRIHKLFVRESRTRWLKTTKLQVATLHVLETLRMQNERLIVHSQTILHNSTEDCKFWSQQKVRITRPDNQFQNNRQAYTNTKQKMQSVTIVIFRIFIINVYNLCICFS